MYLHIFYYRNTPLILSCYDNTNTITTNNNNKHLNILTPFLTSNPQSKPLAVIVSNLPLKKVDIN